MGDSSTTSARKRPTNTPGSRRSQWSPANSLALSDGSSTVWKPWTRGAATPSSGGTTPRVCCAPRWIAPPTSHGGLVLVTGEPGIGKTTLVTSAAREARQRGALVLGAACWDSDSAPGYWPWVQVLRGLRRPPTTGRWRGRTPSRPSRHCSARPTPARAAGRQCRRRTGGDSVGPRQRRPGGVRAVRRGDRRAGRRLPAPAGRGHPRRPALGRPGLTAVAGASPPSTPGSSGCC